jgi:hypothetical protein
VRVRAAEKNFIIQTRIALQSYATDVEESRRHFARPTTHLIRVFEQATNRPFGSRVFCLCEIPDQRADFLSLD